MRFIYWLCSLCLHAAVAAALAYGPPLFPPDTMPGRFLYQVELVDAPEPAPAPIVEKSKPEPPKPEPPKPAARPAPRAHKPPKPKTAPEPQPRPDRAVPASSAPSLPPAPESTPGVANISPVKREMAPPDAPVVAITNATIAQKKAFYTDDTIYLGNSVYLEGKILKRDTLKQGSELRFAIRQLAHAAFTHDDYAGHYTLSGDQFISILDLHAHYGGYAIYHSKTGLFRLLEEKGLLIYVYGPKFEPGEEVEGSVTFFPVKHRDEYQASEKPGHLMVQPKEPLMLWGNRFRFEESEIDETVGKHRVRGRLIRPPGGEVLPGVVWVRAQHLPANAAAGMARALAHQGYAVLILEPPQWRVDPDERTPVTVEELAALARAALSALRGRKDTDGARTGLLAVGEAGMAALLATHADESEEFAPPAFCVVVRTDVDATGSLSPAHPDAARDAASPVLWLNVSGRPPGSWADQLETLRSTYELLGKHFTFLIVRADAGVAQPEAFSGPAWTRDFSPVLALPAARGLSSLLPSAP